MKNEKPWRMHVEICEFAKARSRLEVIGIFDSKVSSPQGWNAGAVLDKQHAMLL